MKNRGFQKKSRIFFNFLKIKVTKKNGKKFNITDTRTMTKPRC